MRIELKDATVPSKEETGRGTETCRSGRKRASEADRDH